MSKISKDQVISDARDAAVEMSGDSSPVTYGGDTGLAARIRAIQGGGGGNVQSDWNENDSTKGSYVKNRPFYTEEEENDCIFEIGEYEDKYVDYFDGHIDLPEEATTTGVKIKTNQTSGNWVDLSTYGGFVNIVRFENGTVRVRIMLSQTYTAGVLALNCEDDWETEPPIYKENRNTVIVFAPGILGVDFTDLHIIQEKVNTIPNKYMGIDWNESDSTKSGYIKNRPLYEEITESSDTILDSSMDRTVQDLSEIIYIWYADNLNLVVGTEYTVAITIPNMENIEFTATAVDFDVPGAIALMSEEHENIGIVDRLTPAGVSGTGSAAVFLGMPVQSAELATVTIKNLPQVRSNVHKLDNKFLNIKQIRKDLEDGTEFTYIVDNPYWVTQPKFYHKENDAWVEVIDLSSTSPNGTFQLLVSNDNNGYLVLQSAAKTGDVIEISDTGYAIKWDNYTISNQRIDIPMEDGETLTLNNGDFVDCDNRYNSTTDTRTVKFRNTYAEISSYQSVFSLSTFIKNQMGDCNDCYDIDVEWVGTGIEHGKSFTCAIGPYGESAFRGRLQTLSTFNDGDEVQAKCSPIMSLDYPTMSDIVGKSAIYNDLSLLQFSNADYLIGCHFHHKFRISKEFVWAEYNDSVYSSRQWEQAQNPPSFTIQAKMNCSSRIDKNDWQVFGVTDFGGCNGAMLKITVKELNPTTITKG